MRPARQRLCRGVSGRGLGGRLALVGAVVGALGLPSITWASSAGASAGAIPAAPEPSGLTATPVLSVRRVPGWVVQTVVAARLKNTLGGIMASPALGSASRTSCLVATQGDRVLFAFNADQPLIPASNVKLLTATAALDQLGSAYRLTTGVRAARPAGGVVAGNLYLVGGGDPLLRTSGYAAALSPDQTVYTPLAQLAAQVHAAGVQAITGAVVGDESRYDQLRVVPTWSPAYAAEGDVGPLSALEVNDGAEVSGSGSVPALPASLAANPAADAAAVFTGLLRADGVRVEGSPSTGTVPAGTPVLSTIASPPLAAEVDQMLTVSDDTAAELFTKELGYHSTGAGTTAAGVAVIRRDLAADGLPVSQAVLYDGSGLDRGDRLTCGFLVADLQHVGSAGVIAAGLPVAARTGTLRDRLAGTPAAGRLRAKTGTLNDVSALSGFVSPPPGVAVPGTVLGQPVVFSLIVNGVPSDTIGPALGDQVGAALAAYPRLPKLAQIEPRR